MVFKGVGRALVRRYSAFLDAGGDDVLVFLILLLLVSSLPYHDQWHVLLHNISWLLAANNAQLLIIFTAVLAIATYGLFQRTAMLAVETNKLAAGSTEQMAQNERQHRQALNSLLCVDNVVIHTEGVRIMLTMKIRNLGFGPALQLLLVGKFNGEVVVDRQIPAIAASETLPIQGFPIIRKYSDDGSMPSLPALKRALEFELTWFNVWHYKGSMKFKFPEGDFWQGSTDAPRVSGPPDLD
jgi:hypothetical protein